MLTQIQIWDLAKCQGPTIWASIPWHWTWKGRCPDAVFFGLRSKDWAKCPGPSILATAPGQWKWILLELGQTWTLAFSLLLPILHSGQPGSGICTNSCSMFWTLDMDMANVRKLAFCTIFQVWVKYLAFWPLSQDTRHVHGKCPLSKCLNIWPGPGPRLGFG